MCARGEPKPFLDASRVKNHRFTPGVGPRAEESGAAGRLDVRVQHTGCVHYVEIIQITVPEYVPARAQKYLGNVDFAADVLRALPVVPERANDVKFWTEKLDAFAKANPNAKLPAEVDLVEGFSWLRIDARPAPDELELEIVYDVAL